MIFFLDPAFENLNQSRSVAETIPAKFSTPVGMDAAAARVSLGSKAFIKAQVPKVVKVTTAE